VRHDTDADRRDSRWRGRRGLRGLYRPGPAAAQPDATWPDVGGLITRRWFAIGAAAALTVTDFPDWQAPQAHADAISTTGVPVFRNITVLDTGPVVNANSVGAPRPVAFGQFYEGYLIEVIPQNPGSRIFAVDLVITHTDASGNDVGDEQVTLSNFQNLGNNTSVVRGRLLGTSLTITCQAAASAWINGVTGSVVTADNVKVRTCGLQTYVPGTGKRVPVIQSADGLLLATSSAVPLGAVSGVNNFVGVLPDYTGLVTVHSFTGLGGGFTYQPQISCFTVSNGTSALSTFAFPFVTSTTPLFTHVGLPSTFNTASIVQRSTISQSASFGVVIDAADQ
jgi:hypothetical protein